MSNTDHWHQYARKYSEHYTYTCFWCQFHVARKLNIVAVWDCDFSVFLDYELILWFISIWLDYDFSSVNMNIQGISTCVFIVLTLLQTWIVLHEHIGSFEHNCVLTMCQTVNNSPVKHRHNSDQWLAIGEAVTHNWGLHLLDQSVHYTIHKLNISQTKNTHIS